MNVYDFTVTDNKGEAHFYLKHGQDRFADGGWNIQKIDMGIALCHFELAVEQCGVRVSFEINDPGIAAGENTEYIASYLVK